MLSSVSIARDYRHAVNVLSHLELVAKSWIEIAGCAAVRPLSVGRWGARCSSGVYADPMVELPEATNRRPDQEAYDESTALSINDLVTRLRDILGVRLVAYIGGVQSTRIVSSWAAGDSLPEPPVEKRLRQAYHVAALLSERYEAITVQSWFKGMNPSLADESPARILRQDEPRFNAKDVIAAARSFAYIG